MATSDTKIQLAYSLDRLANGREVAGADNVTVDGSANVEDKFNRNIDKDNIYEALTSEGVDGVDSSEYVDLGLPSGTLWATCNVGAEHPYDYGDYFAWGETQPKETYAWDTYKFGNGSANLNKYYAGDGLTTIEEIDDAPRIKCGTKWTIPSNEQLTELFANCTLTYMDEGNDEYNGVKGFKVTGTNGNSIFLPCAGRNPTSSTSAVEAWLASSSIITGVEPYIDKYYATPIWVAHYYSSKSSVSISNSPRSWGVSIRPVLVSGTSTTPKKFAKLDDIPEIATDLSDAEQLTDEQTASAKATATSLTQLALKVNTIYDDYNDANALIG